MTRYRYFSVLILAVCIAPHFSFAQVTTPSKATSKKQNLLRKAILQGKVLDPGGRSVSGARVSLLNGLTLVEECDTNADGQYRFDSLTTGTYTLLANLSGFSTLSIGIGLQLGEIHTADLHLKVSAVEERVVVSASLGGALAPQIGSSVSVVTKQEIEDRGAQSVFEILRGLSAVQVNSSGRHGGATSVFIRGGNSNYNLVMVDGIEVNQFGGDFDLASLGVDGVDRIELSRGPESALYGSNAVAGTINIVGERGEGPPHFSFLAEGGSFTTRRFATGGSGLTRGFSWTYNLSRLDSGGVVQNDNYRNQSSYLSLGYSRSPKREFTFHFFGNANDVGNPGPYGSDPGHTFGGIDKISRDKQNLFAYQAGYSEQFTDRLRQVFSVSVAPDRSFFHSPFGDSDSKNLRIAVNTHGELKVSTKDVFVYGFEYNHEQFKDTFIADANFVPFVLPRASYAYFAENRWNPVSRVFLTTGVRFDDFRTGSLPTAGPPPSRPFIPQSSVFKASPRIAAAFLLREAGTQTLGATRLHGSFGTGIRNPNGFDMAFTNNPRLKPEKSASFDSGIEQRFFNDRAVLDVTWFYNRFKDQIVVVAGSNLANLSKFQSDNLANSRAQGVETNLRLRPFRSVEFSAQYTWLDTAILAVNGSSLVQSPYHVGQPFLRRPRSSAGYNLTWRRQRLTLNTNAFIRGAFLDIDPSNGLFGCSGTACFLTSKGYVQTNAGFSYELPRGLEIHGRLNNFLNQKYEEVLGFPALHINFITGIRFHFPAR